MIFPVWDSGVDCSVDIWSSDSGLGRLIILTTRGVETLQFRVWTVEFNKKYCEIPGAYTVKISILKSDERPSKTNKKI